MEHSLVVSRCHKKLLPQKVINRFTIHTDYKMLTSNVSLTMDLLEVAAVCTLLIMKKKKYVRRNYCYLEPFTLFTQLKEFPNIYFLFFAYCRDSQEEFDHLVTKVGPFIRRQGTTRRKSVLVKELAVTLR